MKTAPEIRKSITPAQRQRMVAGLQKEIRHYQRCARLLDRVDHEVFSAGMEMFEDEAGLALWLCAPALSLGGKVPLDFMRSAKGRQQVANNLRAIAHGVYL